MKITKHGTRHPFWKGVCEGCYGRAVFFSPDGEKALRLKADEWLLKNDSVGKARPVLRIVNNKQTGE